MTLASTSINLFQWRRQCFPSTRKVKSRTVKAALIPRLELQGAVLAARLKMNLDKRLTGLIRKAFFSGFTPNHADITHL